MTRGNSGATRWVLTCPDCGADWCEVIGHGEWRKLGPWNAEHPAPEGLARYPGTWRSIMLPPVWTTPVSEWTAEGPQLLANDWEPIRRPDVHLTRRCFTCYDNEVRSRYWGLTGARDIAQFFRQVARAHESGIRLRRKAPPAEDGTKECYLCHRRFVVTRADAGFCSPACRNAMHRRMKKWRAGEPESSAMTAHDQAKRRRA